MSTMDAEAKVQGGDVGSDAAAGARLRKTAMSPDAATEAPPTDPSMKGAHRKTLSMSEEAKRAEDFINVRGRGGPG